MNSENTSPLENLRALIHEEEEKRRMHAVRIRISNDIAQDIASLTAEDWHSASNGWAAKPMCARLADHFMDKGPAAANGLKLGLIGPTVEVATALDAPHVEIIEGVKYWK